MKPQAIAIVYVDIPLIEARSPSAPQPVNSIMLYRTAERVVRGEHRFYYAGTPPRYVQLVTQGFSVNDVAVKAYYNASVSRVATSTGFELLAYQGRGYTRIVLRNPLDLVDPVDPVGPGIEGSLKCLSEIVRATSDGHLVSPLGKAGRASGLSASASRFDPHLIAADTLGRLLEHYSRAETLLGWPDLKLVTDNVARGSLQPEIELLCRIANGEVERSTTGKRMLSQVNETVERVIGLLCDRPMMSTRSNVGSPRVPKEFWQTHIGQVICVCQKWLHGPYWTTYRQATKMLYGESSRRSFNRINRLVEEGRLMRYEDPDEPNPQRAGRFDRREIERLLSQSQK